MLKDIVSWIKSGTEAGVALIAFAIVLQVIFGGTVPFIGGDIIAPSLVSLHNLALKA